jgi:hypothetical protein
MLHSPHTPDKYKAGGLYEKSPLKHMEYEYKKLSHECIKHMELREASDRDLVNCYKSL